MQIRRNCHYRKSRNTCLVRFIVETLLGYERCGYFGVPFSEYAHFSVRFHHCDEGGFFYLEVKTMPDGKELNKEYYLEQLKKVAERENRLPKKSDFSEYDVMKIKGFFGPWPWALEEAGLKEPKKQKKFDKNRAKRLARKKRLKEERALREKIKNEE